MRRSNRAYLDFVMPSQESVGLSAEYSHVSDQNIRLLAAVTEHFGHILKQIKKYHGDVKAAELPNTKDLHIDPKKLQYLDKPYDPEQEATEFILKLKQEGKEFGVIVHGKGENILGPKIKKILEQMVKDQIVETYTDSWHPIESEAAVIFTFKSQEEK